MRSDHWNFLANLLGTPGPAQPPKQKEEPAKREPAQQESEPELVEEPTEEPTEEPIAFSPESSDSEDLPGFGGFGIQTDADDEPTEDAAVVRSPASFVDSADAGRQRRR